ncbi:hypothetical protein C5S31_10410 [ANME-1 cluster archaeon GoMg2]|nr:hypothetical protein [ANME-1 cluster archaeon GoMg2]
MNTTVLSLRKTMNIKPQKPYNFRFTILKPSHFPANDVIFDHDNLWKAMIFNEQLVGVQIKSIGKFENPQLCISIYSANEMEKSIIEKIVSEWRFRCGVDMNISEFINCFEQDTHLQSSIHAFRGMRPCTTASLYEYIMIGILLQNTNITRTISMMDGLLRAFGTRVRFAGKEVISFWTPETMYNTTEEQLRKLKVGYRSKTIIRVSDYFYKNPETEQKMRNLTNDDLMKGLQKIYGVGPATAGYISFDVFHRLNILNHISPWERRIYAKILFDEDDATQEQLIKYIEKRWGEWKMLAAHYLFEFWHMQQRTREQLLEKKSKVEKKDV